MKRNIEEQLRQAILKGPMSRYRLSQLTGVSEGSLSMFVNRQRGLTLSTAAKLAKALGLELRPKKRQERG